MSALIAAFWRTSIGVQDLLSRGLIDPADLNRREDWRAYEHPASRGRMLNVTTSIQRYELGNAHANWFGIVRWRTVVVSIQGALDERLADQKRIGRTRRGGERSPAPLPDWYDLTHLVYEHGPELGFDPDAAVYQYLPGRGEPYLNIAEALHLRQPK